MITKNTKASRRALLALLCSVSSAPLIAAQQQPQQEAQIVPVLTLQQALSNTLAGNPSLLSYPFSMRASQALKLQANISPTTEVALALENFAGSKNQQADYSGGERAEYSLTLSQVFELGAKREKRFAYADAEQQQKQAQFEVQRLAILADTSRQYFQLLKLQYLQKLWQQRIQLESNALKVINQRAQAGAVNNADQSKMRLRLSRSENELLQIQQTHQRAKMQLANVWLGEVNFAQVAGKLTSLPRLVTSNKVKQLINKSVDQLPALQAQLALQKMSERNFQLMQANGRSNLTASLGIKQIASSDNQALTASISMPLSFSNPNRGLIAKAKVKQELSQQQLLWQKKQLSLQLDMTAEKIEQHKILIRKLETTLIPQAQTLLKDVEQAYRAGQYSVLQWVDAQSSLFSLQHEKINRYQHIYTSLLELEQITGSSMLSQATSSTKDSSLSDK